MCNKIYQLGTKYFNQLIWPNSSSNPFTNVYGFARSCLAVGTCLTLLLNDSVLLFYPFGKSAAVVDSSYGLIRFSLFHIYNSNLVVAKVLAIFILILVISGWRPRITGGFHWWISFSVSVSCVCIDGGDQVTAVLTLFLLPATLMDNRKWHWSINHQYSESMVEKTRLLVGHAFFSIIRLQVCVIYLHAAIGKTSVNEWVSGTAVFYWFTHPVFGAANWLKPLIMAVITNSLGVVLLTWGTIIFELILAMGLVMNQKKWEILLVTGILFHFSILLVHGLASFFFAMTGALILYLRPMDKSFFLDNQFTLKPNTNYLV